MKRPLTFSWHVTRMILMLCALVLAWGSAGCSATTPTPTPTPTPRPPPTPTPTPQPLDLIVLHTNDVLGYTEPCG